MLKFRCGKPCGVYFDFSWNKINNSGKIKPSQRFNTYWHLLKYDCNLYFKNVLLFNFVKIAEIGRQNRKITILWIYSVVLPIFVIHLYKFLTFFKWLISKKVKLRIYLILGFKNRKIKFQLTKGGWVGHQHNWKIQLF